MGEQVDDSNMERFNLYVGDDKVNRAKYAVLGLKTLEKYPDHIAELGNIDYVAACELKLCDRSELEEISRATKRRAMKDLVELGLVEQVGKAYGLSREEGSER